jgi:VanZ family protein
MWDNADGPKTGLWRAWRPALVWAIVIFGLSSIPGSVIPEGPVPETDKLVHIVLYGVLALLVGRALGSTTSLGRGGLVALAALLATAYGVTDELHQLLTPRRSCDVHDVFADAIGGLAGGILAATVLRKRVRRARGP